MSDALFTQAANGIDPALSAGTNPAGRVHLEVVEVMRELGLDLSDRTPQLLTRELADQADVVVTMGCGDQCAYIPGKRYIDWEFQDPAGQPIEQVRAAASPASVLDRSGTGAEAPAPRPPEQRCRSRDAAPRLTHDLGRSFASWFREASRCLSRDVPNATACLFCHVCLLTRLRRMTIMICGRA
jgi:arsenate reductase (thioredoxin)